MAGPLANLASTNTSATFVAQLLLGQNIFPVTNGQSTHKKRNFDHRKTHRSASKGDIDTEGGDDSEEENYARDDESIESNWEADQPELAVVPPISTGVRKDGPITTRSVEGYGRNAVAEQDPEANTTKGARANEGTSTSNSAHKHSGQREAKLAAAVSSEDDEDDEKFKESLNSILEWVWEHFPQELAARPGHS
ncbi:MAG: hypothetical protein M1813_006118 [Trichoglossum hirsutum]|nr:MAG: hypothetical protein M1813_006118 [Trichoglossum hirsutum]